MALRFGCRVRRDSETVVRVGTAALDRAFAATNPELYQSVSEGRIDWLMELELPDGDRLQAPIVGVCDGGIVFENGRHRARAALWLGRKAIPVIVAKAEVAELRALLARFSKTKARRRRPAIRHNLLKADTLTARKNGVPEIPAGSK